MPSKRAPWCSLKAVRVCYTNVRYPLYSQSQKNVKLDSRHNCSELRHQASIPG